MGIMTRAAALLGFAIRSDESAAAPESIMPPPRAHVLTSGTAIRISTVYRAVEVLAIGVSQLGLDQWRGDRRTPAAAIIVKPDTGTHRAAFLERTVVALALDGNYWRILRDPKATRSACKS